MCGSDLLRSACLGVTESMSEREIRDLNKSIEDLKRELRADFCTLKESVKFCNDTCDDVNEIKNEIKELRKEVQRLTKQNNDLPAENQMLNEKINELEQYQRSNNLEIQGVPEEGDAYDVVKRIGALVGEPIVDTDVDICHRVPTFRPREKNIVVRFVQRSKRDTVLKKCKKQKITTKDLDYGGEIRAVYVNEHLTSANKKLMGAARAQKKKAGWMFAWSSGGKIFAQKDERSDRIRIARMSDVDQITR